MKPQYSDYFQDDNDRNDFFIALPVIALAGFFVLFQMLRSPDTTQGETVPTSYAAIETTESRPFWSSQKEEVIKAPDLIEEDVKVTPPKINRSLVQPMEINRPKAPIAHSPVERADRIEEKADRKKEPAFEKPTEPLEEQRQVQEHDIDIDEDRVVTAPSGEKSAITPPPSIKRSIPEQTEDSEVGLDCSIAVGLYVEEKNRNKMMARLRNAGYKALSIPLRRSTKVAIKIPCSSQQSQEILRDIRANFASDAFIE